MGSPDVEPCHLLIVNFQWISLIFILLSIFRGLKNSSDFIKVNASESHVDDGGKGKR